MPLFAASLPIVRPCPDRAAYDREGDEASSWCNGCGKVVHDLSAMRERDVRELLARSVGTSICVDYRERADGTIRVREAAPTGLATVCAAVLSGCASHLEPDELAAPGDCVDEDGCDETARLWGTPDDAHAHEHPDAVPSQAKPGPSDPELQETIARGRRPGADRDLHAEDAPRPSDDGEAVSMRVDFKVDPQPPRHRGCLVVGDVWHEADGRLRFVPTRQLISDLRERIRERRGR
jgi:hypothetical protein